MDFDTSMNEAPCIEEVEYDTAKIPLDRNGRPVGISLDDTMAALALKLIDFYGEGFRAKVNHYRAGRGLNPL